MAGTNGAHETGDPMLNALHSVEARMSGLEARQETAEHDNAQHREDDRLAFAGLHTAIIDLGDKQSREFSGMLDVVRHRVDGLILEQEKAKSYADGVKDARKPSPFHLAAVQGIAGQLASLLMSGFVAAMTVFGVLNTIGPSHAPAHDVRQIDQSPKSP